ncbi:retrovirus-related pol polyprotein from transposon TNT 1-94 [Tanacetum coccineum]
MNPIATQQANLDNTLVPSKKRLKIERCNSRIALSKPQKEETCQVTLEALKLSRCYPAFMITAEVPQIYMHQFWNTITKIKDTDAYSFKLDKKKCRVDTEVFCEILQICPRILNQDFIAPPSEEDLVTFIQELGYSGRCNMLSAIHIDQMHQPWRTYVAIINRCISGKTTGLYRLRESRAQILWGMYNKKNVDYIITSLKALNEGYSSKNYVRKFLRALHPKWIAKVMAIEEPKDLTSLSLDELIGNLKAKKESSDEECLTFGSEDEEYAMAVRDFKKCDDPNHLIGECLKPSRDKNQKAFVGGSWSDSGEEDDEKVNDEACLVAQAPNEVCSESSYFSDENSSIDDLALDNEYDKLCKMSLKIITKNKRLKTTRNSLEKEIKELKDKLSTLKKNKGSDLECTICQSLKIENGKLKEEALKLTKFEKSTHCLNEMLSNQKSSGDKLGLGFNSFEASSSGTKEIKFICLGVDLEPDEWIKDSGCSKHMAGNRKLFSTYKAYNGGIRKKGLYVMKLGNKPKDKICLATIDENSTLWHRRLGHANMHLIQSLASKELVRNLPKLKFDQHFCDACKIGKPAHASHKAKNIVSTTRCLELLHMDLFGPSAVRSYGGNRYTLVIVDDYSSKCFILNTKDYLTKFDPKSYEGVFLGYSQNSKAYIILNKHTRKIEESLNVTFDETPPPSKTSPLVDDDLDEEEAIRATEKKNLENVVEDETLEIDEIVNIKESRNHPLENVIGNLNQRTLRSQAQNQSNFFCFISTIEPKNVNEALGDESWIVAMQEELNQFIANDV